MENWHWDPDKLTSEERLARIIELLAKAGVRLALKEKKDRFAQAKEPAISLDSLLPAKSGPVPFGQKAYGLDRIVDEGEAKWIKRIQELHEKGLSTEKIAKVLNLFQKNDKKWSDKKR